MDIEGSEYSCINSLNDLRVDQICIEWHHWLGGEFTIYDTISSIKKIESFGYTEVVRESENPPKRYIKESIFIKNSLI
jgi:aryl-alcohol dehydrogenase-like predicted oxidoreductase